MLETEQRFDHSCLRARYCRCRVAVAASLFLCVVLLDASLSAQGEAKTKIYVGAEASEPVTPYLFDGDLRQLPSAPQWQPGDPIKELPRRFHSRDLGSEILPRPSAFDEGRQDPLLLQQERTVLEDGWETPTGLRTLGSTLRNFDGMGFSGVHPPDPTGDVDSQYYIQAVNTGNGGVFKVYNKFGGAVTNAILMDSLAPQGTECAVGLGDPIVLYDHLAGCWLISEFSRNNDRLCVYVSRTSDPVSGGWFAYEFSAPDFPDYPKYGVWPDAYYVGTNEHSPALYAMERDKMLRGLPASMQRRTVPKLAGFNFQMLMPADVDGPRAPASGSPGIFMRHRDDELHNAATAHSSLDFLEIWTMSVDWDSPADTTVAGPLNIQVAEFDSTICNPLSRGCLPQPGTTTKLAPLREVVMPRLQYRNHGSHESLVGNYSIDVGSDRAGLRWFELRRTSGSWFLHQEGTFAPGNLHRWMGSAAADRGGNMAIGYSVTSEMVFPGLRYVGRTTAAAHGTLNQVERTLAAGSDYNGSKRYGDYSALAVDPEDDCTFWFTGEYNRTRSWETKVGSFRFTECDRDGDCVSPPNNMVGWWTLDETTGTVARDFMHNENGVHRNGPARVAGKVDFALDFDGLDDHVDIADDPRHDFGTEDFSIDAWIRTTSNSGTIVSKRVWTGSNWTGYIFMVNGRRLLLQIATSEQGWFNFQSGIESSLTDGEWHHVAVTVDRDSSSGGRMYLDGSLIHTFNPTGRQGSVSNSGRLFLGATNGNSHGSRTFHFRGAIDEVELFNRALSAAEIQGIFVADFDGKCKTCARDPLAVSLSCENLDGEAICDAFVGRGVPPYSYSWIAFGGATVTPAGDGSVASVELNCTGPGTRTVGITVADSCTSKTLFTSLDCGECSGPLCPRAARVELDASKGLE